jgi:hypothetical protein
MAFCRLSRIGRTKLLSFEESGTFYWPVRPTLRDGRVCSNVAVDPPFRYTTKGFKLGFPDIGSFNVQDIVDIQWECYRGVRQSNAPVEVKLSR